MEIVKSLLFIIYVILLHVYSKESASKLQRYVYNSFILVSVVWLISFSFFPHWKIITSIGYVIVNLFAIKELFKRVKAKKLIIPAVVPLISLVGIVSVVALILNDIYLFTLMFNVCFFGYLVVIEKIQEHYKIGEKRKAPSKLNDREKILRRIKQENIILLQKASYSPNLYTFNAEINVADNSVFRNYIIEPLHPEIGINRQAHSLAHELGHYYDSMKRSRSFQKFIQKCRNAERLKPICGLIMLYDEWSAWKHAEKICIEEGVDIRFFNYSRKLSFSTYVKAYWDGCIKPIKTLLKTYIFSVAIVLFSVLLTETNIHLPFKLDEITNIISGNKDRTGIVNLIFINLMMFRLIGWIAIPFMQKKIDRQYVEENDLPATGNTKQEK
ncbi:hypothetical protein NSQ76_20745 [Bacillus sp. FSL M8-0256]|uniref:hypothetical protein n=1 Tax=Bacillus sp. FSL M8-0256 TaxID=2954578 RepID=UPI0030FA72B4